MMLSNFGVSHSKGVICVMQMEKQNHFMFALVVSSEILGFVIITTLIVKKGVTRSFSTGFNFNNI